jgi:hypothetical protein
MMKSRAREFTAEMVSRPPQFFRLAALLLVALFAFAPATGHAE